MKKWLLIAGMLFLGFSCFAQDMLIKRNGQRAYVVVRDISKKKVTFQMWGYPYSPIQTIKTKSLWGIRFANGQMVRFDHLWKDDDDDDYSYRGKHHKHHHQYHDGYYYYRDQDDDDDDREELIEDFLEDMREQGHSVKKAKKAMEDWEDWMEDMMDDDD